MHHGPPIADHALRWASTGGGAPGPAIAGGPDTLDHSTVQARVQQQWYAALAHAVGAEAVAGGDTALRELLQVCAVLALGFYAASKSVRFDA